MGLTSTTATRLIGPIYAPNGTVLYDPTTDGALANASKLTTYPLTIGVDVPHDTAAGVGALASNGTAVNSTQWGGAKNDITEAEITNYSTTSTSAVSTGIGLSITPSTTRVLVSVTGEAANNTSGDGSLIAVYSNTTGVPTSGTSVGTDALWTFTQVNGNASAYMGFAIAKLATGLTASQTYYFYVALQALGGGTAILGGVGGIRAESR